MKLPSKIRIKRNIAYAILRQDIIADDPDCMGLCDSKARAIIIRSDLSDKQVIETLIHELFHAVAFEFGVKIPHKLIYALEAPVLKILKLNKWI